MVDNKVKHPSLDIHRKKYIIYFICYLFSVALVKVKSADPEYHNFYYFLSPTTPFFDYDYVTYTTVVLNEFQVNIHLVKRITGNYIERG